MRVDLLIFYFASLVCSSVSLYRYQCPNLTLQNGRTRLWQRGRFVKYMCNSGFMLSGDKYSNCIRGHWDNPSPKCVRPGCKKVHVLNNGLIFPSHLNSVLHYYCKSGFKLRGPSVSHCNGTSWDNNMPTCLVSNATPELSCDFEKPDICGWTHDLNHDFDWRRMQFSTPSGSIGTGPSYDHTLGKGNAGYYMYIESSSRNPNDTAKLISPVYEKTDNTTCFKFFYHMYGATIGTLRVYMKMENESWNLNPKNAFFEKHGNQGDRWIGYSHAFDSIPNDYQIIIEGVRGTSHVSDIAIDDVSIIEDCSIDDFFDEASSTTETEDTGATDFLPDDVYSCENKCFSTAIMMGAHRKCACDENCYDRNDCCPDYIDFCVLHGSTSTTSEYFSSSSPTPTTPSTERPHFTEESNSKEEIVTTLGLNINSSTVEMITPNCITQIVTDQVIPETTTRVEEIVTRFQDKSTMAINAEIKTSTKADEVEYVNKMSKTTTDISNDIPQIPDDMIQIGDVARFKGKYNEKIVFISKETKNYTSLYMILGGIGVVLIVLTIALVKRRSMLKSTRFRSASHGDSASDVRFLTSDELLDLNLDYE